MANTAATPTIFYSFDAKSPSAVRAARRYAAQRVTEINAETRAAIRALVLRGFRENIPPRALARILAGRAPGTTPLIGMHSRQAMAALNFREQLKTAGFSESEVTRLVGQYTRRKVAERALNIARTETMTALNYGRSAQFNTARGKGLIRKDAGKEWIVTPDERLCLLCAPMAGVVVRVDKKFSTPRGEVPAPPLHPSCRCTIGLKPVPGGKRQSPVVQPTAPAPRRRRPKVAKPKVPKKPRPRPATPTSTPAPTTTAPPAAPPPSAGGLGRPEVSVTYQATGEAAERLKKLQKIVEDETRRLGDRFVRTRGVKVPVTMHPGNIPGQEKGVLGLHTWKPVSKRSIMQLQGGAENAMRADRMLDGIGTGRNAIVNPSVAGAYRHELGHALHFQTLGKQEAEIWNRLYHGLRNQAPPPGAPYGKTGVSSISQYAEYNQYEMFAEAWTVYSDPNYKEGMLPKYVHEFLERTLNTPAPADSVAAGGEGWFKRR